MIDTIDGATVFGMMIRYGAAAIQAEKQSINDLNVFPVPDGDTGTNMSLTISHRRRRAEEEGSPPAWAQAASDQRQRPAAWRPRATPASFCPSCSAASAKAAQGQGARPDGGDFAAALS